MKKGYLLLESLIGLFCVTILSGLVFYTYESEDKLIKHKRNIIEEVKLEKEIILGGINKCTVKDISQPN